MMRWPSTSTARPSDDIPAGRNHLISKSYLRADEHVGEERSAFLYRLPHPLGEHVVDGAKVRMKSWRSGTP
jgi:hypothetical protein